jgi:hypothetical protein
MRGSRSRDLLGPVDRRASLDAHCRWRTWVFVVTGLEALMNTSRYQAQMRFVSRVRRLAGVVGVRLTDADLERGYDLRSGLVHGQQLLSEQASQLSEADSDL